MYGCVDVDDVLLSRRQPNSGYRGWMGGGLENIGCLRRQLLQHSCVFVCAHATRALRQLHPTRSTCTGGGVCRAGMMRVHMSAPHVIVITILIQRTHWRAANITSHRHRGWIAGELFEQMCVRFGAMQHDERPTYPSPPKSPPSMSNAYT